MHDYDLIIIGSGPSGRRAAVQSAKIGKSVLVVEKGQRVGGVSVHTGTIPSKTLRETILNLSGWRERGFYGRSYRVKQDIDASDLLARLRKTLDHEVEVLEHQFSRNAVRTVRGQGRFAGPHEIEVTTESGDKRIYTAAHVLVACGTRPFRPDYVPFNRTSVFDSDEVVDLPRLPRSLTVIGAGVIGVEYATIFNALDVAVTLIDTRSTFLDFVDRELIEEFVHDLRDRNISLRLGSAVTAIEINEAGRVITRLANGRSVTSEMLLFAAGREGATDDLNLAAAGLEADNRGRIAVEPKTMQTSVPHIYAAGDIIGFPSLASTSMEQGRVAACHAFDMAPHPPPEFFPYGIYSVPEISTIGMSEEEVRKREIPYECGIARFRETSRGHIMGLSGGMMKMILSTKTRRLLGVHIVGEGATELIHIGQAVLNLKGTIDYFIENTFNYPTLAEAYKIAGLDAWNRMASA
jgi:NAD(P) transhydrogenase